MINCVNLNKRNLNNLKELSFNKWKFNPNNEDFFDYYSTCNFAQQLLAKRHVKLAKLGDEYIGYIWYEPYSKKIWAIKSMYSRENEVLTYRMLIESVKFKGCLSYNCQSNDINNAILKELGFNKSEGVIELYLNTFEIDKKSQDNFLIKNNLSFREFNKGKDENLRCCIQNEVFDDINRLPLNINDIYFDESQNYYMEQGAVFLYKGETCAGYGQIIFENEIPHIVNVGIRKEYQGLKYGRALMNHLLEIIDENKFPEVCLRVKSSNFKALSLYKSLGFIEKGETCCWELKR